MDTRLLKYFMRVIETGSISRAARQLGVAQPALSQYVAALEVDFNAKLLFRSTRGVTATAAGQVLYRYAQQMLRLLDQAHEAITTTGGTIAGRVTLGLPPGTTQSPLPINIIRQLSQRFPGIALNIHEGPSSDLRALLLDSRIDLAIICNWADDPSIVLYPLFSEELRFVGTMDLTANLNPLQPISCAEMNEFDLILPGRDQDLRKLIDQAFAREGLAPHAVHESDSLQLSCLALKSGLGGTFLSSGLLAVIGHELGCRDFATKPAIWTNMCLGVSTETPMNEPTTAVLELIVATVQDMLSSGTWPGVSKCRQPAVLNFVP